MSDSNPSAASASQRHSPDIQQLVGLLGNLMPLLLRLQSQGFEQPFRTVPGNFPMPNSPKRAGDWRNGRATNLRNESSTPKR